MNIKYIITKVLWKKISSALTETMQEASKIGGLMDNCSNPKIEKLFLKWKKKILISVSSCLWVVELSKFFTYLEFCNYSLTGPRSFLTQQPEWPIRDVIRIVLLLCSKHCNKDTLETDNNGCIQEGNIRVEERAQGWKEGLLLLCTLLHLMSFHVISMSYQSD